MKIKLIIVSLLAVAGLQGMQPNSSPASTGVNNIYTLANNAVCGRINLHFKAAKKIVISNHLPISQDLQESIKSFLTSFKSQWTKLPTSLFLVTPCKQKECFDVTKYSLNGPDLEHENISQNSAFGDLKFTNVIPKQDICMVNGSLTKEKVDHLLQIFNLIIFNQPADVPYTDVNLIIRQPEVMVWPILNKEQFDQAAAANKDKTDKLDLLGNITAIVEPIKKDGESLLTAITNVIKAREDILNAFNINKQPLPSPISVKEPSFFWNHKGKLTLIAIFAAAAAGFYARYMRR